MPRRASVVAICLMIALLLSACGGQTQQPAAIGDSQPAPSSSTPSSSPAPTVIKFGYVTARADQDPYTIGSEGFKRLVEEKTGGKVKIELFPAGQLGGERDMIEGLQVGTLDGGLLTNAYLAGFETKLQVFDLPFLFKDAAQAHAVMDGPVGQELLDALSARGIKALAFAEGGFRHMINNVRPIRTPADAKGIKFRSMESPMYIGMFRAIGANPSPIAWPETFTAVQQKAVDGLEIPIPVIHQNKYYEVTKYLSLTGHTYSPLVFCISGKKWSALPADVQRAMADAARQAAAEQRKKNAENLQAILNDLKAKGMQVNEVDNAAFKKAVEPLYGEFQDKIGKDIVTKILAAVK